MASNKMIVKNLSSKSKVFLFGLISLFAVIVIISVKKVYAYYHDAITSLILANKVGDFDLGDGDINMMIYRENNEGKFVRIYAVPAAYYKFNDELTACTIPCNDGSGNCEYTFDNTNRAFALTSNQKITCKFYFEQEVSADIEVYVLLEDETAISTYTYNSKNYSLNNVVPAYGYIYADHYECENAGMVTYNSETKKVSVASATKDKCYIYFDKSGSADISVNVYVQDKFGGNTYSYVDSIPGNKLYTLNSVKSKCVAVASGGVDGSVSYTDGYINVVASSQQVCDVYLDLESN